MNYLFAILFIWLVGTGNALKCKFLSTDVTQAESPEEQLMINKTSEAKEYECPAEDKNCVNMKGFLTKIDPETGEQKNMTFGLKSCESDLARLMEPIERTIEQQLNYTCGASSSNENQTAGPITYSLECCSTDDCNVGDNNNNTIEIIFPSEDITDIMQKDEENNKENNNENPIFSEENNNTFVSENSQENPTFTETGENKTFELTQNEDLTSSTPLLLLDNSTQPLEMETDNNTIISTNTTKENPRNGVNAIYNSFSMFSLLSTCLFIGSIIITY